MWAPANSEVIMKAQEIFDLAERIAKLQVKEAPPQKGRRRNPRNFKHLQNMSDANVAELLQRKWNELDALAKVVEDRAKATKKEEKKEEKKIKTEHMMAAFVASYPIIALIVWLLWR